MKKQLIIFCCLMAISALLIYPILMKGNSNTEISPISEQASLNKTGSATTAAEEPKKVLMHYMGWFGPDSLGRHWDYGLPRKPIIGFYNSQSWATQMYHILLSWSCGIDGLVINVKDKYDSLTLERLMPTLKGLGEIDSTNFNYKFAISYDDQRYNTIDAFKNDLRYLKKSIIPFNKNYLRANDTAFVFVFDYDGKFLSAKDYRLAIDEIFPEKPLKLCWNESQDTLLGFVDVCYPWVQPYNKKWDRENGLEWGSEYLKDFFWRINNKPQQYNSKLIFACSAVWPGFDDRPNWKWGEKRWMDRKNGAIYDSTWSYLKIYDFLYPTPALPLNWVIIETWNDWNEGSEIEPSTEFGYKYLKATIKNINAFKNSKDSIKSDTLKFLAAKKIYEAANLIESGKRDSATYYPCLQNAIKYFIKNQNDTSAFKLVLC